jgi:hypothetical protein
MSHLIDTINQVVASCRKLDENFDKGSSYSFERFKLSFQMVPEADLDTIASAYGQEVHRGVSFGVGTNTCPTVTPSVFFQVGELSISLHGIWRKATIAEIDQAVAEIKKKVENCCKPNEGHA